jgi:hypothetical protein
VTDSQSREVGELSLAIAPLHMILCEVGCHHDAISCEGVTAYDGVILRTHIMNSSRQLDRF